jgi:hypothetical protein
MGLVRRARHVPAAAAGDAPAEVPASRCPHQVAESADEALMQAFLHGRDCLDEPPSQRHLASQFGVPRTRVAALVGSLNGQHSQDAGETLRMSNQKPPAREPSNLAEATPGPGLSHRNGRSQS